MLSCRRIKQKSGRQGTAAAVVLHCSRVMPMAHPRCKLRHRSAAPAEDIHQAFTLALEANMVNPLFQHRHRVALAIVFGDRLHLMA